MASEQIESVIGRLTRDRAFRVKYCQDPDGALETYLSPQEIRAVKAGDGHSLSGLGHARWEQLFASLCSDVPSD